MAILFTNEYISKLKSIYTKLQDWTNAFTLLYRKTLEQSMVDLKNDEKEAEELENVYNHYVDKSKEFMKNTRFQVEDTLGAIISKNSVLLEQLFKIKMFLAKIMWKLILV